jgi:chondroitin 4-sulfotransferase 11
MLISHKYKIIFIHIPKNSGTYIWNIMEILDNNIEIIKEPLYQTHHYKAKEVKELLKEKYKDYKSFCIIRNPYDSLTSLYEYIKSNKNYPILQQYFESLSFIEFVKCGFSQLDKKFQKKFLFLNYIPQRDWIYDNNTLLIDNIIKYENMYKELGDFFLFCNIPKEIVNELPFNKIVNQSINKNYKEYYTPELIDWIKTFLTDFNRDIVTFNYESMNNYKRRLILRVIKNK